MTLIEALKVNEKARLPNWGKGIFLTYSNDSFRTETGEQGFLSTKEIMSEEWEPHKEPCKHEPPNFNIIEYKNSGFGLISVTELSRLINIFRNTKCIHCGAKIKAVEWEEV